LMMRIGYIGEQSSNAIAFAWFVFEHGHSGPATIGLLHEGMEWNKQRPATTN